MKTVIADLLKKLAAQLKEKFGIDLNIADFMKMIGGASEEGTQTSPNINPDEAALKLRQQRRLANLRRRMKAFMQKMRERMLEAQMR